ncbi:MAG TPA: phytanoyl-CoA dioxygenase family protein, partial [Bacteroidia bacterium]|nr:phytanoyl-CoA dioxygenase family protein [Bacteroidia bacterium]
MNAIRSNFKQDGHAVIASVYSPAELMEIIAAIDRFSTGNPEFQQERELFAIRRVLQEIPSLNKLIFTPAFNQIIDEFAEKGSFLTKSIYFDKPPGSNWFVAWHQDISISVDARREVPGYAQWTAKLGVIGVVPPLDILDNSLTLRIHLDDTDATNGALKVIRGSHKMGIVRKETLDWSTLEEVTCDVPAGGV